MVKRSNFTNKLKFKNAIFMYLISKGGRYKTGLGKV